MPLTPPPCNDDRVLQAGTAPPRRIAAIPSSASEISAAVNPVRKSRSRAPPQVAASEHFAVRGDLLLLPLMDSRGEAGVAPPGQRRA